MKTEAPKAADTQKRKKVVDRKDDDENKKELEEEAVLEKIDDAIDDCRRLYVNPLISKKTRDEYEKSWEELRSQKKVEWMQENVGLLMNALRDADSYRQHFESVLNDAVREKLISTDSQDRWWGRFYDPDVLEWNRKHWIEKEFSKIQKGWKETAEKRDDVLKLATKNGLTKRDIPELSDLDNIDAFLSFHYLTKIDKTSTVKALILAHIKDKERFITSVRKELDDWAKSGWLHKTKVGPWLERVMKSDDPEKFATDVLWPFMQNWQETREDFDKLNAVLDGQDIPRGFSPVKEDKFLLMEYKQRTSYCALAWLRLQNVKEENKEMARFKMRIRHNLDTGFWPGAEDDVKEALKLNSDDRELLSMQEYLQCHRSDTGKTEGAEEPNPSPQELVDSLRVMFAQIPGSLRWLYENAAMDGPQVLHCMMQIVGNGPWAVEHGYTSEADKQKNMHDEANRQKTAAFMKEGVSEGLEHKILDGETAAEEAITDDCTKAQYIYMSKMGRDAVLQKVRQNAGNVSFAYWSILEPTDISLGIQNGIVKSLHYPLKSALRQLHSLGYRYTRSGRAESKNGQVEPVKDIQKRKSVPSFSMPA